MFTAFLTKFRSSPAARSMSARAWTNALVARALVMHAETPNQGECRTLDELPVTAAPLRDLVPGMRRPVEQIEAHRIAKGPVVEFLAPAVHLRRRDPRRIAHEGRQHARLVHAGFPERLGKLLVVPELLAECLNVLHRDAKRVVRRDGITRHAVSCRLGAVVLQPPERRLNFIRDPQAFHAFHIGGAGFSLSIRAQLGLFFSVSSLRLSPRSLRLCVERPISN